MSEDGCYNDRALWIALKCSNKEKTKTRFLSNLLRSMFLAHQNIAKLLSYEYGSFVNKVCMGPSAPRHIGHVGARLAP